LISDLPTNLLWLTNILLQAPSLGVDLTLVLLILVLLVFTAIVSGAEVAFFSLDAKDINYLKTKQSTAHKSILHLLEQPKKLLATVLIANSFLSIGVIISTNIVVEHLLNGFIAKLPLNYQSAVNLIIQIVLVTFLLVLFGEVLPKVYATQNNMRMSKFCAPFILFISKLFSPISKLLVKSSALIEKNIAQKNSNEISDADVEHAIHLTVGHTATKEEVNIFKGILKFGDITVKQIMRTRLDVNGIENTSTFDQLQKEVLDCGYSRLPVFEGTLDTVKGIIHTKDLLVYAGQNNASVNWHALIRPAFFVPEGKLIEDLLSDFQKKRIHMAVVVDEFGGTSGVVTLEDIMEEIIGEIKDEFDEDENDIKKIEENIYICEGKSLINDVCRAIGEPYDTFDEVRGESDSLAGLLLEIAGRFPRQGESMEYKKYMFTAIEVEKNRIKKIKLTIKPEVLVASEKTDA
jgi:putative hemolysin